MLNDAQRKLQEELIFTQVSHVMKDQKAATGVKRSELDPAYHVLSKVALYDTPYTDLEFENKTIIAYNTAVTREYMHFGFCKEWKLFTYDEFQEITKSTLVLFVNGLKIWFRDIQIRVRKDQIFFIIPKKIDINTITVIEVPKTPHDISYRNENRFDILFREYINNPPLGFGINGEFNLIEDPPVYSSPRYEEGEDYYVRVYNQDWVGTEYEVYQPQGARRRIYISENDILEEPYMGFKYRAWIDQSVTSHQDSLMVFLDDVLIHPSEYKIEYKLRRISEYSEDYVVYIYTNTSGSFNIFTYDDSWTKLKFKPYNILTRYDSFFSWSNQEWQGLLPTFIKDYKDLEFVENDLYGDDQSVFFKTMTRAITNFPEWYNRFLDTLPQDRKFIMYKDLVEDWKHKMSNRNEIESRFQAVDFVSEHVMLNIRNEKRSDDIAIYYNGLKYTGIRHIIHSRNFSFVYILKSALHEIPDDNSYFELEIKPSSYYTFSHSARFNGDAMMVIPFDDPKFPFTGNMEKIKFFFNGKCIRRRDVLYSKDLEGNHSFFFNIKAVTGDIMSLEYSNDSLKEVNYLRNLPVNGVLNVDSASLKYPLSTKYYEIYVNGRRMSYDNEHFISNFLIQFKYIKGNYHIVIYEKSSIDSSQLNSVFNNTVDGWDRFVKSDIKSEYLVPHEIVDDTPYDTYTYTLAQYRMHLFFWWFIVPRDLNIDATPAAKDTVYNEVLALFPDFINSKGEIVIDAKTSQTSKMLLSNNYRGNVANIEHIVTENKPIDSNTKIDITGFPSKGMVDGAARVNVHATGLPRLLLVPTPKK